PATKESASVTQPSHPPPAPAPPFAHPAPSSPAILETPPRVQSAPQPTDSPSAAGAEPTQAVDIRGLLLWPGLGLLVCGVLGVMRSIEFIFQTWKMGPEGALRTAEEAKEAMPQALSLLMPQQSGEELYSGWLVLGCILLLVNLGTIIGAIQMLR